MVSEGTERRYERARAKRYDQIAAIVHSPSLDLRAYYARFRQGPQSVHHPSRRCCTESAFP